MRVCVQANLTLCGDVSVFLAVAVHVVGVDVVRGGIAVSHRQFDSTGVETQHVRVPVLWQVLLRSGKNNKYNGL